jgi:predicted DNA-binding transcriptional regulator AlpA
MTDTATGAQLLADDERLLLMQEVSERTRMSLDTLRYLRWTKTGPPSFRLGRRVVYPERQLMRWIREQQASDQSQPDPVS